MNEDDWKRTAIGVAIIVVGAVLAACALEWCA